MPFGDTSTKPVVEFGITMFVVGFEEAGTVFSTIAEPSQRYSLPVALSMYMVSELPLVGILAIPVKNSISSSEPGIRSF